MSIGMKYECNFHTLCGRCGQFSAPTAPSVEILLTILSFFCIGTNFTTCFFPKIVISSKNTAKNYLLI